jgi:hypothetical protein
MSDSYAKRAWQHCGNGGTITLERNPGRAYLAIEGSD